ncbi:MAG: M14 family metallopeptidase [Candidatus Paceibacterota bacterium]
MRTLSRKQIITIILTIIVVGFGLFLIINNQEKIVTPKTPVLDKETVELDHTVIGTSIEGRDIEAYTYQSASERSHLIFVGGIHGGYEWNTVILAYSLIDYLNEKPEDIPNGVTVTIIPSANPDGVYEIIGKEGRFEVANVPQGIDTSPGRFNARQVDLNRNFNCKWSPEGNWRGNSVSTGSGPFSEPESVAIRDFVIKNNPDAVVFWHSQANTVYASECENGIIPETLDIMNLYATAANYNSVEKFDAYEVNGDAEGWLASIGVPAITVELETHETVEWERNLSGVKAIFEYFNQKVTIEREAVIENYIRNNISELSSESEVLGGTFYVTNIQFNQDNSGLVEYEDGHIALVADFTYSFNDGEPQVKLSNVRDLSF